MAAVPTMQTGLAALQRGDAATAAAQFEALRQAGGGADVCLALAFARVHLEDAAGALSAVDLALEQEPRNLRALLFKADHLDRMGRSRQALGFYQASLQVGVNMGTELPQDVRQGLGRAQAQSDRYAREYEQHLRKALHKAGYGDGNCPRFAESLDILGGHTPVYFQQPTRYLFPGLTQAAFFPREQFPWLAQLEAQSGAIREELRAVLEGDESFSPYLELDPHSPQLNDVDNVGSMDWSAFYLWQDGEPVAANAARCPRTMQALAAVPAPSVPGQTPTALFSRLKPGVRIPPHNGMVNTRLICHLPLVVPANCGALRVGNYTRPWVEGEGFVFDDSIEHEAWNDSDAERVVLLFDIWRPELSEEERRWVSELLQAVDAFVED
ncbi:MAG: aspartate beta-hydroxylase [Halieaceae bacterium]|jgi:aspartate beta-hydroxylase